MFGDDGVLARPCLPLLPLIATRPARQHEHAVPVGEIEEMLVLELPLHSYGIEMHVARVPHLGLLPLWCRAHHHVRRPPAAEDDEPASVDAKEAAAAAGELRCDLANAELRADVIGDRAAHFNGQVEIV